MSAGEIRPLNKREEAWVQRLHKTLKAMPPGLWMLCTGDDLHVMREGEDLHDEGTRRDACLDSIYVPTLEAGDW